ncbi:adenine phosphoribosyltransferase [Burkholderia sp. THE68]|uniref:adenine phosphoribosyltransferase n=1 Tax=Burkholderiaceae TaxID=119060 RepID=UPI001315F44B|nr:MULTISPECIES: adenine phosphoribosyltransferase [Burkholderiaceae]BBU26514.1 adenine phosphoribosyltransferase [Burkholderia sp. THE68]BCQ22145.1 adenine phosphoribosyltransferase [Caballeronia sp. NK8]
MSLTPSNAQLDAARFIKERVRTVDDWPQPGVQFRDITPVLQDRRALRTLIDLFVQRYIDENVNVIAGMDARGFIIGPILAYELSLGFVPIRKKGKLPYRTLSQSYDLEYGSATVEIHEDACKPGDRVVIVDDLVATGGTMMAGKILLERLGANVVEAAAIIDLPDLGGSKLLRENGVPLYTVCEFGGH